MVAQRDALVDTVAVRRVLVECPAGQHRGAHRLVFQRLGQVLARRRPDQRPRAVVRHGIVALVRRELHARRFVAAGDRVDGAVDGERDAGFAENRHRLLRLAERVRVEHRRVAVLERLGREGDDRVLDLVARGEDVLRPAERALHQHHVAALDLGRLARVRARQLEVAGVDEAASLALDHQLRAAQDVARREERQPVLPIGPGLVEAVLLERALGPRALGQQRGLLGARDRALEPRGADARVGRVVTMRSCSRAWSLCPCET